MGIVFWIALIAAWYFLIASAVAGSHNSRHTARYVLLSLAGVCFAVLALTAGYVRG